MEERAGRPRVPRLPPESPASFYRKGAGHVPGRPFVPGPRLRLPAECLRYSSLLLLVYWLVARSSTPERATVIVNMPELEGDLRRSERWIRRGFHTLAAYGLLYSIPTVEEDGVDRRRYRFRLLARAGVDITSADRDAALADLADSESEETEEFPDGVPWLRTNGASGSSDPAPSDAAPASPMAGRTLSPAAALDNREEGSGSPDGAASPPTPAAAAGVGTAEDGTTSEELALAHAVLAAPIPHDIRDKLVAIGRKTGYRLRGRHPRWAEASSKLVETTMAAIRHRYGEVRPVPGREGGTRRKTAPYRACRRCPRTRGGPLRHRSPPRSGGRPHSG